MGNGELRELVCTTHRPELREEGGGGKGVLDRAQ